MKAKEPTRPILDRKKLREKSYGPEYSPAFRRRNVARGPVNFYFSLLAVLGKTRHMFRANRTYAI